MKKSADFGGFRNTFLDLQYSSYPTQPHSKIANLTVIEVFKLPFTKSRVNVPEMEF